MTDGTNRDDETRILDFIAAAERTALAWERTGFGVVAVGAVLLHESKGNTSPNQFMLGIIVLVLGAVTTVLVTPLRYRRVVADVRQHRTPLAATAILVTMLLTATVSLASALLLHA